MLNPIVTLGIWMEYPLRKGVSSGSLLPINYRWINFYHLPRKIDLCTLGVLENKALSGSLSLDKKYIKKYF